MRHILTVVYKWCGVYRCRIVDDNYNWVKNKMVQIALDGMCNMCVAIMRNRCDVMIFRRRFHSIIIILIDGCISAAWLSNSMLDKNKLNEMAGDCYTIIWHHWTWPHFWSISLLPTSCLFTHITNTTLCLQLCSSVTSFSDPEYIHVSTCTCTCTCNKFSLQVYNPLRMVEIHPRVRNPIPDLKS